MNTSARQRGGCLSLYLLLAILGSVLGLVAALGAGSLNTINAQLAAENSNYVPVVIPAWYVPASVALIIVTLVAIYGIFAWKKWGVYLLVAEWVLSFLVAVAGGQSIVTSLVTLVIEALLLAYVLRGKWPLFEG